MPCLSLLMFIFTSSFLLLLFDRECFSVCLINDQNISCVIAHNIFFFILLTIMFDFYYLRDSFLFFFFIINGQIVSFLLDIIFFFPIMAQNVTFLLTTMFRLFIRQYFVLLLDRIFFKLLFRLFDFHCCTCYLICSYFFHYSQM